MGRKSRLKRERARTDPAAVRAEALVSTTATMAAAEANAAPRAPARGPVRPPLSSRQAGARVARVAVDDATWAAFRDLCGSKPASIRLGELVAVEVERARNPAHADAAAAVAAIRAHVDELEAFVRGFALPS